MMRCFSCAMPMPVSVTENAITLLARFSTGCVGLQPVVAARCCSFTEPCSVNFSAFESRFFSTCCSRFTSVRMTSEDKLGIDFDREADALAFRHVPERAHAVVFHLREAHAADFDVHLSGFDLGQDPECR